MARPAQEHRALSIGALASRTGCKVQTIRYYEQIGLLPPPDRTAGNQRSYQRAHADRLAFIRHSRELGFPLEAIRSLLTLVDKPNQSCAEADRIARAQLREVERLNALKTELERMVAECHQGKIADCHVIEVLTDHSHSKCLNPDHGMIAADASL